MRNIIIIAGGRDFANYDLLKAKCDKILSNIKVHQIVSGGARGADALGEKYAKDRGYGCFVQEAAWDKYGRSAGYIRNKVMADNATHLIAFWDGKSKGTMHMINIARDKGLKVRVIKY